MHKVEEAENAAKEAENANKLMQQELERGEDLRAQIAEVEDQLEDFQLRKTARSCPPSPKTPSFSKSSQKLSGSPPRNTKVTMRSSIADTQYKLNEYEDLLGYIFAPPEVSPRLTPHEEEIVAMIYNNSYNDFLQFKDHRKRSPKSNSKRSRNSSKTINDDKIESISPIRRKNHSNEYPTKSNEQLQSYDRLEKENYFDDEEIFTEENDALTNYSYIDDEDDQFLIHDQFDSNDQSSNEDTVDEILLTLPDSFHEIFRNYLPRRIFKTVLWLKQLPKHFRKQSIPIKRKTISVFRVASHEASLLKARIAFLERRKFASSSPKRFNTEIHRYEIQLLILGNEMRRFRF